MRIVKVFVHGGRAGVRIQQRLQLGTRRDFSQRVAQAGCHQPILRRIDGHCAVFQPLEQLRQGQHDNQVFGNGGGFDDFHGEGCGDALRRFKRHRVDKPSRGMKQIDLAGRDVFFHDANARFDAMQARCAEFAVLTQNRS